MSKPVLFVVNEKGGTGKSFFSRGWLDLARGRGKRVAAFDADGKVATLLTSYGTRSNGRRDEAQDPLEGIGFFDMMDSEQQEVLLNAIDVGADAILIDTPAGSLDEFERLLGSGQELFSEYRKAGYQPYLVFVLDTGDASTHTVVKAVRRYGESVGYVVVKNLNADDPESFTRYDKAAAELVGKAGGSTICMPVLREQTTKRMDENRWRRFSDVVGSAEATRTDRVAVRLWLSEFEGELAKTPLAVEAIG